MNKRRKILAINGSYRAGGVTDQAVSGVLEDLKAPDVEVEHVKPVSYTHLTLPTTGIRCRSRWSPEQ